MLFSLFIGLQNLAYLPPFRPISLALLVLKVAYPKYITCCLTPLPVPHQNIIQDGKEKFVKIVKIYKSLWNDAQNPSPLVPYSYSHSSHLFCIIASLLEEMQTGWYPFIHVVVMPSHFLFLVHSFRPYCRTYLTILDISLNNIPHHFRTIFHHILLAAHTTIGRHWKASVSPRVAEMIGRLNFSCHSKMTLTPFNPSPSNKADLWSCWIHSKYYFY